MLSYSLRQKKTATTAVLGTVGRFKPREGVNQFVGPLELGFDIVADVAVTSTTKTKYPLRFVLVVGVPLVAGPAAVAVG
jgi:hypothetical protein